MITVRQIQKLWDERCYARLTADLLAARIEDSARLRALLSGSASAAALGLIRLTELNQSSTLAQRLIRAIVAAQSSDGGWEDPLLTALCLRALMMNQGNGDVILRGILYLAALQKPDGAWPAEPLRRMPADAYTSALVLLELAGSERFRNAIRFDDALNWFEANGSHLDDDTRRLWSYTTIRLSVGRATAAYA